MENQRFTYEAVGQVLVVHMPRELDHHNCRNLKYETDLLLEENPIRRMVFDFSKTEFMDSSGIGILLGRYKQLKLAGGEAVCCCAGKQVKRILREAGIEKLIPAFEQLESAIKGWEE